MAKTLLDRGIIAGAGLDVLPIEPPTEGSVLFDSKKCLITPHNAWATADARSRLMYLAAQNLKAFLNGRPVNVIY